MIAISESGEVHCYQLKDGDIDIKKWQEGYSQIVALVETRPRHPSLPDRYHYRVFLVTNGSITDPALDRIHHHNDEWQRRSLPKLEILDGRWLHRQLVKLSSDFWPTSPPNVRAFRALYLVDGRGDFQADAFSQFLNRLLPAECSKIEAERRAAAVNLFTSYILGEFYRNDDHWTIFRAWSMCAARISWAIDRCDALNIKMSPASFVLAKDAALDALENLANECKDQNVFRPRTIEWDEYTRVRNTVSLGAWSAWHLINLHDREESSECISLVLGFIREKRLVFWGESAFVHFCSFSWLLERHGHAKEAKELLFICINAVIARNQSDSTDYLPGPHVPPEEALAEIVESLEKAEERRPRVKQSYSLLPLVLLLTRKGCKNELSDIWRELSHVTMTIFRPAENSGYLEWECKSGSEIDQAFPKPQSWQGLKDLAESPAIDRLPVVLRADRQFRQMFFIAFPHRLSWSIIGSLDSDYSA